MAGTTYVIDKSKCLRTLTRALESEDVAAKSHASTTDEYGKASAAKYGHVQLTNESALVGGGWSDSSAYRGKAVSGEDGADFDARIKANAQAITAAARRCEIPVGAVIISAYHATAASFAQAMGYGTWELLKHDVITKDSGGSVDAFYFQRTD